MHNLITNADRNFHPPVFCQATFCWAQPCAVLTFMFCIFGNISTKPMVINSREEFTKYLTTSKVKRGKIEVEDGHFTSVTRRTFKDVNFKNFSLGGQFVKCKFIECSFENVFGFFFNLNDCIFETCSFERTRFSHFERIVMDECWDTVEFNKCKFSDVRFDEGEMINIYFNNCTCTRFKFDVLDVTINVNFTKCTIDESFFYGTHCYSEADMNDEDNIFDLAFYECRIDDSFFNGCNLRNSIFFDSELYKISFLDCQLHPHVITQTKESKYPNYAAIDFQTILKSDDLPASILRNVFNIYMSNIKEMVKSVASPIILKTVFISYSFKDKIFAQQLNKKLLVNGIKTFLWEKDAPGGQSLENIMEGNVKKHDKILFIASGDSIKSKACQFELSQARKKQEATWSADIFYVVHIDNYLFEVKKNAIRPISKAEEYWENIEELRRVNSKDLCRFNYANFDENEFDSAVENLLS